MKKGKRERERGGVNGDGVCGCSLGELLDNKKPFTALYLLKHVPKNKFVLFI